MKSIKLSIVALFIASASFAQVKEVKTETAIGKPFFYFFDYFFSPRPLLQQFLMFFSF